MSKQKSPPPAPPAPPKPRQYVAPPCSACAALREPGSNYSRVYGTTRRPGEVSRYVKCGFCNFSWVDRERVSLTVAASEGQ
jgi:hypothetical protein